MCFDNPGFYTILGVIIGFSLNFFKDYCLSQKTNNNVKELIKSELSFNKESLEKFIQNIELNNNDLEIVCPDFSLQNWNNLLSDVPKAFEKDEVKHLFEFYYKLEQLINSDIWIKLLFNGEPQDLYGQSSLLDKPITNENIKLINNSKINICDKMKELLCILKILKIN